MFRKSLFKTALANNTSFMKCTVLYVTKLIRSVIMDTNKDTGKCPLLHEIIHLHVHDI